MSINRIIEEVGLFQFYTSLIETSILPEIVETLEQNFQFYTSLIETETAVIS